MYKLYKNTEGDTWVFRTTDNTSIPMHESNADYQQYLKWVEEGNTPLPADEGAA
jgi:hypothetical protein